MGSLMGAVRPARRKMEAGVPAPAFRLVEVPGGAAAPAYSFCQKTMRLTHAHD